MRRVLRAAARVHAVLDPGRSAARVRGLGRGAIVGRGAMTTEAPPFPRPEVPPIPIPRPRAGAALWDWLTPTDHKRIGLLYIGTSFVFFLIGGLIALAMRAELAQPGIQFVDASTYNQLFSMHGTLMMLLFGTPLAFGFGNYLIPL